MHVRCENTAPLVWTFSWRRDFSTQVSKSILPYEVITLSAPHYLCALERKCVRVSQCESLRKHLGAFLRCLRGDNVQPGEENVEMGRGVQFRKYRVQSQKDDVAIHIGANDHKDVVLCDSVTLLIMAFEGECSGFTTLQLHSSQESIFLEAFLYTEIFRYLLTLPLETGQKAPENKKRSPLAKRWPEERRRKRRNRKGRGGRQKWSAKSGKETGGGETEGKSTHGATSNWWRKEHARTSWGARLTAECTHQEYEGDKDGETKGSLRACWEDSYFCKLG